MRRLLTSFPWIFSATLRLTSMLAVSSMNARWSKGGLWNRPTQSSVIEREKAALMLTSSKVPPCKLKDPLLLSERQWSVSLSAEILFLGSSRVRIFWIFQVTNFWSLVSILRTVRLDAVTVFHTCRVWYESMYRVRGMSRLLTYVRCEDYTTTN